MPGSVPAEPERWGELDTGQLAALLEAATRALQTAIEEVAVDEAAYHRTFWQTWQQLPDGLSVAAATRACESAGRDLQAEVILKRALMEAKRARRDGLAAVLGAKP